MIINRKIPDPSMSDAEFIHQRAQKPNDVNVGRVWAQSNEVTRIGGLAYIRSRLGHHERAAEWFKSAYEGLYGGVAPAVDMGKIRVDTSIMAHDNGAVDRIDRSRDLVDMLGTSDRAGLLDREAANRIVANVVLCIPCINMAPAGPSGRPSGRAIEQEKALLLAALDTVAELRGFKMVGAA